MFPADWHRPASPGDRRGRRNRRRNRRGWRTTLAKAFTKLLCGLLLVGCSSTSKTSSSWMVWREKSDPIEVLKTNPETDKRIAAYRTLGNSKQYGVGDNRRIVVDLLAAGARDERSELARSAAVTSLAKYDEPASQAALAQAASDKSSIVRADVCRSLGKHTSEASLQLLGKLAALDKDLDVRVAATEELASRKDPRANAYLLECLKDKDIAVARTARSGLKSHLDIDLGNDPAAWVQYMRDHGEAPTAQLADQGATDPSGSQTR